jgi:TonB-dependent starch-binding outer membrane protein SusC
MVASVVGRVALIGALAVAMLGSGSSALQAQETGTIRGTVVEAGSLRPLSGVQVFVVGTTRGSISDSRGRYQIVGVPAGTREIRARMVGYAAAEQNVTVALGATVAADFTMTQAAVELDEIVVTGTAGGTERRAIGNVVATVNAAAVTEAAPIRSTAELLQGRAPGLTLMQPSGTPGTASNIRIRGASSYAAGNMPVFYIDGVRMTAGTQGGWSVSGQSTSALDAINPDDIESIEVIKGPAASTLYGADAAAGVVQIITKKGRRGQQGVQWNAKMEMGTSEWGGQYPTQWALCTPARINTANNIANGSGVYPVGSFPGCAGIDPNLPDEQRLISSSMLRDDPRALRTGDIRSYGLSGRGGGDNYSFYFSGDRDEEQGIFHNSDFGRTTGRMNFTVQAMENLDMSVSTSYTRSNTRLPNNDNSSWGLLRNVLRSPAGRQGTFEPGYLGLAPDQINAYDNQTRAERAIFGATVNFRPTTWFRNRLNAGLDWNQRLATLFFEIDRGSPAAYGTTYQNGAIRQYAPNTRNWTLDYAGTVSLGLMPELTSETSFGMQLNAYRFESLQADGFGLVSNQVRLVSNAEERNAFESFSEQNSLGFFIQEQLGWRNRLFVTGALRFDDNSAFGSNFDRVIYPKAQVSWVVSEEPFFRLPVFDQLRLRGAWGRAGNSPAPFEADRTWGTAQVVLEDGSVVGGLSANDFGNPELRAETGQELELGFDASVLNDRLGLEFTYYNARTSDALLTVPVAPSSGFTGSQLRNVGEIANSGIEISLFGSPVAMPNFNWDARVGIATNRNEMVTFGGTRDEPIAVGYRSSQRHAEGYPLAGYWAYPVARDANGQPILTSSGWADIESEMVYVGPSVPTREASLTNTFTLFQNFSVYTFLDYKGGHYLFNMGGQTAESDGVTYTAANPNRDPEDWAIRRSASNEMWIEPADFLKLRELSVTYRMPGDLARRIGAGGLSLTLAGRNLATWTDYSGLDPETNINGADTFTRAEYMSVPPTRRLVATVNVNF